MRWSEFFSWFRSAGRARPFAPANQADPATAAGKVNPETWVIATSLDYARALVLSATDTVGPVSLKAAWESPNLLDQIGAAIQVRKLIAHEMPDEELKRYVSHLALRYRASAGDASYERYLATAPKTLASKADALAEADTLLDRLRLAYSIVHLRDSYMSNIRGYFLLFLLFEFVSVLAIFAIDFKYPHLMSNFVPVVLAGLIGSTVSILRRTQSIAAAATFADDPVVQVSALEVGYFGLYAAALSGGVFAVILTLACMGGFLNIQGLTPEFCTPGGSGACPASAAPFTVLQHDFALKTGFDAAKLLFLCFLSGFAEQLVPDVLDRFAQSVSKKSAGR